MTTLHVDRAHRVSHVAAFSMAVACATVLSTSRGAPAMDARSLSVASRCPSLGPTISLGRPSGGDDLALFSVDGSELVFAADRFSHGGILDPDVGVTAVYVGDPDRMPVYVVKGSGDYTNVTHEFSIWEGQVISQTLPAGRYWLVTSNFVHVTVRSCRSGGVTGVTTPHVNLYPPGQAPSDFRYRAPQGGSPAPGTHSPTR